MEEISKDDYDKAEKMAPTMKEESKLKMPDKEKFEEMMEEMQNPIKAQKEMAVKIKIFLDHRIDKEMKEKGELTQGTRHWIESYNKILDKLQSAIHGDKSINLHIHKVSHSDIQNKIRESTEEIVMEIAPIPKKKKKGKSED